MLDNSCYQRFLIHIRDVKRLSSHTLISYDNDLRQCNQYLSEQFEVSLIEATHHLIRSWVVVLMEEGIAPASINRKLSALRSFYVFAKAQGQVTSSPVSKITSLRVAKRLPVTARLSDLEQLLDILGAGDTFDEVRDHTIITLLFSCGLRRSELLSLSLRDIDITRSSLKVMGKGAKERSAPLLPMASEAIHKYLAVRASVETELDTVFITAQGGRISDRKLYSIVKKAFALVTTQNNISPHKLRHTFATHLLNQGADLLAVKELLGHASLAATQVYTHNDIGALQRAYQGAHPRS